MPEQSPVFEVRTEDFDRKVVAASAEVPIVVDFWAEWCAPCRSLGSVLERVVASYEGRVRLAKVNVDEQPRLAARFGVRGIPAVKIFRDGEVATEFTGALPEADVHRLLESVVPSPADRLVARARKQRDAGEGEAAEELFRNALREDSDHAGALLGLAELVLARGRTEEARQLLSRIGEGSPEREAAEGLLSRIEFDRVCGEHGGPAVCEERARENPDELSALYHFGCCLAAHGEYESALQQFLAVLTVDRTFMDGAAREAVLRVFSLVGPRSELATTYRRKLAAVLY